MESIGKEVTVKIDINGKVFIRKMHINWDSLRNPKHRIVGWDKKGNAIFIMLEKTK